MTDEELTAMVSGNTKEELIRLYERTVRQIPASLEGYAAMPPEERKRLGATAGEINTAIWMKQHESRWLTWFGVKT